MTEYSPNHAYTIDTLRPDEAPIVRALQAANWQETYAEVPGVSPEWLAQVTQWLQGSELIAALQKLIEAAHQQTPSPESPALALAVRAIHQTVYAGNTPTDIIGFTVLKRHGRNSTEAQHMPEIDKMHTVRGFRGQGIASELLWEVDRLNWLASDESLDAAVVRHTPALTTVQGRPGFYRRYGFEPAGVPYMWEQLPMQDMRLPAGRLAVEAALHQARMQPSYTMDSIEEGRSAS